MSSVTQATDPLDLREPDIDVERIRGDFPILERTIRGKPLVYLDNAATTHKPRPVIEAVERYYREENSNIHRGVHLLSQEATKAYEDVRAKVQRFLGASRPEEIVFVRGTTEAINLVASSFLRRKLHPGDEILITGLEHHSNIVPWQLLREQTGAILRVVPVDDRGELIMEEYHRLLGPRTRLVAVGHASNALGTINPVREMTEAAHAIDVPVLVDGAQAVSHLPVDVAEIGCDFYAFSGHKLFAPTGIGALYGRHELLDAMPPYQGGGDMIASVSFDHTTYAPVPHKFEAGTPNIAATLGLGAAIDYVQAVGLERIAAWEDQLLRAATAQVEPLKRVRIIGQAARKASILSFVFGDVHPHDIGTILDQEGIAVRAGHHCAQPVMERFEVPATVRASFAFYNTHAEVEALVRALHKVREVFR